ncbi:hypothetical protein D3C80_1792440 [compost metagenome]
MFARVLAKKLQGHAEYRCNLGIVGTVLDKIGYQPDKRRNLQPMQGNQRAQGADDLDQTGGQADFFFRFTQRGKDQVRVFGVTPPAGESHFATMCGKALGAQGQDKLGVFAAGYRQ